MLFYKTSGEFGLDDFSIQAEELFLLDIGTPGYTEYDTDDEDLIKFMMTNPSVRGMRKGHIHSHNNMGVFFSSTDTDELCENCVFHNFYLSLIVNNKNEMCAQLAFKAHSTSDNTVTMKYRNQNGEEKTNSLKFQNEEESIYIYNCKIEKPGIVGEPFEERFHFLEKKSKSSINRTTPHISHPGTSKQDSFDRWKPTELWDDLRETNTQSIKEAERQVRGYSKDYINSNNNYYSKKNQGKEGISAGRIRDMLVKLLSLDHLYEGTLETVMLSLNSKYYDSDYFNYNISSYLDTLGSKSIEYYVSSFPEDEGLLFFDDVMEKAAEIVETYFNRYPELSTELSEAINLTVNGK